MSQLAIVKGYEGAAGAVVWWTLRGDIDLVKLREAWELEGMDPARLPQNPSAPIVVARALVALLGQGQELRPIRKLPLWEVETAGIARDSQDRETVTHAKDARIELAANNGDAPQTLAQLLRVESFNEAGDRLELELPAKAEAMQSILNPNDVSSWLTDYANRLHAASLRSRGGFYFIPKDRMGDWTAMVEVLKIVSAHTIYSLPAMDCQEAVNVILEVVASEAGAAMDEVVEYLAGTPSTKGLNAWERDLQVLKAKVQHYTELLGRALPELEEREKFIRAGISAARLTMGSDK